MSEAVGFRLVRDNDSGVRVTITCPTPESDIYFTLDETVPSKDNGTLYAEPFTLSGDATVKAIAVKEGLLDSEIAVLEIAISEYKVIKPVISATAME